MLEFFRKYQRFFFLVVTVVIILSFSFFGAFSTFTNQVEVKDRPIGKALGGSELSLLETQRLARFLSTDAYDAPIPGAAPNFLNDGVIRKDFLAAGLADQIVEIYFEPLKEELQARLSHAQRARFYSHPEAPFISVQAIWDQFHPALSQAIAGLRAEKTVSPVVFSQLSQLYLQQGRLPPEMLRKFLLYQMQQYSTIRPDPELQYGDLSLFGYHTLQDWFGGRFIDLAAQIIQNTALAAQEKGFCVGDEEAKADLLFNFERAMAGLKGQGHQTITFQHQLKLIGLDEKGAVEAWKKVLLFRRYFQTIGDSVLVDGLPYRDLASFAGETAIAQVYRLPDSLCLKTVDDLFAVQFYLDSVGVPGKDRLALPVAYRPIEEIEKKTPEFVETLYKAQAAQVSKGEISLKASLKQIMQWQFAHWDLLSKKFTQLSRIETNDRFAALEKMDPSIRLQMDAWSRLQMVDEHPDWIEEAFHRADRNERSISLSSNRVNLDSILDVSSFGQYLARAAEGDEDAQKALFAYSGDGAVLYRFEGIEKISDRQVRTLDAVKREGILQDLSNRYLEENYPKIRVKSPSQFQSERVRDPGHASEGEWKPFSEVKEAVGFALYSDIRKAIDAKEKTENRLTPFYVSHRMAEPMRQSLIEIQKTLDEPKGLDQFKLVRQEKKLHRTAQENWMNTEAFILVSNQWSPVHVPPNGQIVFFYLQERTMQPKPLLAQLEAGKETISRDARRFLAKKLLDRIQNEKAVTLPMQKEDDHV